MLGEIGRVLRHFKKLRGHQPAVRCISNSGDPLRSQKAIRFGSLMDQVSTRRKSKSAMIMIAQQEGRYLQSKLKNKEENACIYNLD